MVTMKHEMKSPSADAVEIRRNTFLKSGDSCYINFVLVYIVPMEYYINCKKISSVVPARKKLGWFLHGYHRYRSIGRKTEVYIGLLFKANILTRLFTILYKKTICTGVFSQTRIKSSSGGVVLLK